MIKEVELQHYVRERELLLEERDRQNKMWETNRICINEIVLENLIELGLFRETWNLVKSEFFVYSEKAEKLYIQHGEIQKQITGYLDKLKNVGSVQYLQVEQGVIFRHTPNSYNSMPYFEFTIGTDVRDFIRRNKVKVRDSVIEDQIKNLQNLQKEYQND